MPADGGDRIYTCNITKPEAKAFLSVSFMPPKAKEAGVREAGRKERGGRNFGTEPSSL